MNKQQFLAELRARLSGLPQSDLEQALDFYGELIDDHLEDGMTEEEAVAALGPVEDIVGQIVMDTPLPRLMREKVRPSRTLRVWEILLLLLGSPVWLPLLLSAAVVVLTVYLVIWVVVVCLYAVALSFAATALGSLAGAALALWLWTPVQAIFLLGAGLICAGFTIAWFLGCNVAALAIGRLSRRLALWMKTRFLKKESMK